MLCAFTQSIPYTHIVGGRFCQDYFAKQLLALSSLTLKRFGRGAHYILNEICKRGWWERKSLLQEKTRRRRMYFLKAQPFTMPTGWGWGVERQLTFGKRIRPPNNVLCPSAASEREKDAVCLTGSTYRHTYTHIPGKNQWGKVPEDEKILEMEGNAPPLENHEGFLGGGGGREVGCSPAVWPWGRRRFQC